MTRTVGIVSGSGPEAGLDLQAKVLAAHRHRAGPAYSGDTDALSMIVFSEPELGWSMDLDTHRDRVWDALARTVAALANHCDLAAIACNTLNVFAPDIEALDIGIELVSVQGVLEAAASNHGWSRVGLLGAAPVTDLGPNSAFTALGDQIDLVVPGDTSGLHDLIHDIKAVGHSTPQLERRLNDMLEELDVRPTILACTELPLVAIDQRFATVDMTALLAEALVDRAWS